MALGRRAARAGEGATGRNAAGSGAAGESRAAPAPGSRPATPVGRHTNSSREVAIRSGLDGGLRAPQSTERHHTRPRARTKVGVATSPSRPLPSRSAAAHGAAPMGHQFCPRCETQLDAVALTCPACAYDAMLVEPEPRAPSPSCPTSIDSAAPSSRACPSRPAARSLPSGEVVSWSLGRSWPSWRSTGRW